MPPFRGNPSEFLDETYRAKTRGMGLLYGENCMILTSTVFDWSKRVTDGQTDGQMELRLHMRAIAYYAVARKNSAPTVIALVMVVVYSIGGIGNSCSSSSCTRWGIIITGPLSAKWRNFVTMLFLA